ncbi:MAG: acylase, partial [Candidatus Marinimicrobia bacterium]|nr:acylase [Candidatus Neomarinimicrobiota bacterium]
MKTNFYYKFIILISLFFYSCESNDLQENSINWDSYGVPHIKASTKENLFFSQGWALMHNHANKVLKLYGKSRGRSSEYWGEKYISNDYLVH